MQELNILFLGASKRTSLLERFILVAESLNIKLNMFSCEISEDFCPISHLATILEGPKFSDEKFLFWLDKIIQEKGINIVIPNMDQATVALSEYNEKFEHKNCWCVVSSHDLCEKMNDKILADKFFKSNHIPTFENTDYFPKIVKAKLGFGAKGQYIVNSKEELNLLSNKISIDDYIIQDYKKGIESTVDIYISPKYGLKGYIVRDRLVVSDGEVMNCVTRIPEDNEKQLIETIASIKGWEGCITLQYMKYEDNSFCVVEINPRFGGGATCGIACGLDMPKYILQEYLGNKLDELQIKNLKMVRSRRDFFYEY